MAPRQHESHRQTLTSSRCRPIYGESHRDISRPPASGSSKGAASQRVTGASWSQSSTNSEPGICSRVNPHSVERLSIGGLTVIGVAANVKLLGPEGPTQPHLYMPVVPGDRFRTLLIRTSTPVADLVPAIEAAVASVMSGKPQPLKVDIVDDQFRVLTADRRFNAAAMSALGVMALLIATSGIYATTAAMVAQQRKEIGIRMALGASAARVVRAITGSTARLLGIGALFGMVGAWTAARILESVVFQVRATDVVVYLVPLLLIAGGGVIATLLPALKAARVNPLETLRSE